jgi:hypothetical protein
MPTRHVDGSTLARPSIPIGHHAVVSNMDQSTSGRFGTLYLNGTVIVDLNYILIRRKSNRTGVLSKGWHRLVSGWSSGKPAAMSWAETALVP